MPLPSFVPPWIPFLVKQSKTTNRFDVYKGSVFIKTFPSKESATTYIEKRTEHAMRLADVLQKRKYRTKLKKIP